MTPTPKRAQAESAAVFFCALLLSCLSLWFLWKDGFLTEQMTDWRSPAMMAELLAVFLLLQAAGAFVKDLRGRSTLILFVTCAFLWIHRIFLPVIVTGLWMGFLWLLGDLLLLPLRRRESAETLLYAGDAGSVLTDRLARGFLTGCAAYIVFICFLSGFHIGGAGTVRKATALLIGITVAVRLLVRSFGLEPLACEVKGPEDGSVSGRGVAGPEDMADPAGRTGPGTGFSAAVTRVILLTILTLVLLQAGRINITLDYDSVHYSLRSWFELDQGRGIFENLGSINQVYFYPKGLEILTLPLSGTPTYGFVLCFSLWCAVFLLFLAGDAVRGIFGPRAGLTAALLIACTPGVMNMADSAKTDMVTALFQVMAVREVLRALAVREQALSAGKAGRRYPAERNTGRRQSFSAGSAGLQHLVRGLSALALTMTLKPTALVFSAVLFLAALLYFLVTPEARPGWTDAAAGSDSRKKYSAMIRELAPFVLCCAAAFGVTLRTVHLTGYPLVSVFTGIWERLGMHGKYPMAAQGIPNASAGMGAGALVHHTLVRLEELLAAPVGEDGLHIRIAWGTALFPVLLLAAAAAAAGKRGRAARSTVQSAEKQEQENDAAAAGMRGAGPASSAETELAERYLLLTLGLLLFFDLITLVLLWQVDGNYYMLSYVLAAMAAAALWRGRSGKGSLAAACFPAMLAAVFLTCITNWAGARGFTQPWLLHYGFYDHETDTENYMILSAKEPFYRYIINAPRFRLLAMADEPECYLFPCRAESYTDREGSGGNVALVKTLNEFKDYLEKAEITLIYTEDPFLGTHGRAAEIVRFMNEDGSITPIIAQEGCTLYEYHAGIRD